MTPSKRYIRENSKMTTNNNDSVTIQVDCYSSTKNAIAEDFKRQTVTKDLFRDHDFIMIMPFMKELPLIIAGPEQIDNNEILVTLNFPEWVSNRIAQSNGEIKAIVSLEIDSLEWLLQVEEADGTKWMHHQCASRELHEFQGYGVRDNDTDTMIIDIGEEVKNEINKTERRQINAI